MKEDEKWIKAFKDKLEDYSEPMPASGWERLERELMPVTEKRIYPYRRWAVVAAAVVLVVTTAVSFFRCALSGGNGEGSVCRSPVSGDGRQSGRH